MVGGVPACCPVLAACAAGRAEDQGRLESLKVPTMTKVARFANTPKPRIANSTGTGDIIVDWKDTEALRRYLSPNGKILGRRRVGASAKEQRMLSAAIKRARFMALIPYTSATM